MKRIKYLSYILLILVLWACEEDKLDIDKYGSVVGVILDGDSYNPLEGVQVATNPSSTAIITGADGKFEIKKILEGDVAITARKKDFLTNSISIAVYDREQTNLAFFMLKDENKVGSVIIYDPVPGNGAVNQNTSFTFQWNVDQENKGKELEYTVYIFESNSIVQQIVGENLTAKEVVVDDLKYETSYYWYVVAKFEGSNVANSPTWTFKTTTNTTE